MDCARDNRRVTFEHTPDALPRLLQRAITQAIDREGGWLPFDRFMAQALYAPGLGYYAHGSRKFGLMPQSGSDFVTAPELSPLFGRALAVQVADAMDHCGVDQVWEFGAGSGALALQLLQALGDRVQRYTIVDLSGALRARQQQTLAAFGGRVQWIDALPEAFQGIVVGNEVLDAMPVQLLHRVDGQWLERGVARDGDRLLWRDQPTDLRPPVDIPGTHDYLTEIHTQAQAFMRTLADRLQRGAAFFIDYGFPEAEYWHPQRHMGTLICHRAHQSDTDPLSDVGLKDITAHVDFTGIALAAQEAGLSTLGFTSQGRFLLNCGIAALMEQATLPERANALKLVNEHEMGELFKVIALSRTEGWTPVGFAAGDRIHTL